MESRDPDSASRNNGETANSSLSLSLSLSLALFLPSSKSKRAINRESLNGKMTLNRERSLEYEKRGGSTVFRNESSACPIIRSLYFPRVPERAHARVTRTAECQGDSHFFPTDTESFDNDYRLAATERRYSAIRETMSNFTAGRANKIN